MMDHDPNRNQLRQVAVRLGELREVVVFLGGSVCGLLLTDPAAPRVRSTKDVDLIVQVATRADYHRLGDRLRSAGFREMAVPGAPICAWIVDGIRVDVMPTDDAIIGFSNRWYPDAILHPDRYDLDGVEIQVISAPHFIATKLEAFHARGNADYFASHDLEDIVALIDGRAELAADVIRRGPELRRYLRQSLGALLTEGRFLNALPGHVIDAQREPIVLERLRTIVGNCNENI